jgi:hypothetical protein
MVRVVLAAALASMSLWLCACAGTTVGGEDMEGRGGSAGSPSKPATSPSKQCEAYASTWCTRAFTCYVQVGRLDEGSKQYNIDQCKKVIIDRMPCSEVQSVGSSYSTCLSQIKSMACSKWDVPQERFGSVAMPVSCDEALAF